MKTALLQHPNSALHAMHPGHPECPARLQAILERLRLSGLLQDLDQPSVTTSVAEADLLRVHPLSHLQLLRQLSPRQGLQPLDEDTALAPHTLSAAFTAAGSATAAVDLVMAGDHARAFCLVRPPGHHAEREAAMGFCFVNSIAVAAMRALEVYGLERVAILDFDVHHGNGTVDIFRDDPRVLVCSSYQHPFYPGRQTDVERTHIVLSPLPAGTGSLPFRRAIERDWLPALERHRPQLLLVSAGFDAHVRDPLADLALQTEDFHWITRLISSVAADYAYHRIVSLLEGGYDLQALAESVEAHLSALRYP